MDLNAIDNEDSNTYSKTIILINQTGNESSKKQNKFQFSFILKISNELHTHLFFCRIFHWLKVILLKGIFKLHFMLSTPFVYPKIYEQSYCCFYRHMGITFLPLHILKINFYIQNNQYEKNDLSFVMYTELKIYRIKSLALFCESMKFRN